MCAKRFLSSTVFASQLLLMATIYYVADSSSLAGHKTLSVVQSSSSFGAAASRQKRAPGWGKRAPGWGKRNIIQDEDFLDQSESALRDINNIAALKSVTPFVEESDFLSDKRAPGWGKRAPGWGKRAPGWGKRAPGWGKRSCYGGACLSYLPSFNSKRFPPWGKTVDGIELNDGDFEAEDARLIFSKRAPGWGKRNYQVGMDNQGEETNNFRSWDINKGIHSSLQKNRDAVTELINTIGALSRNSMMSDGSISADRRAPGWGKRNSELEFNYGDLNTDKRAPGWGKRAPGWGKRNYDADVDDENDDAQKRAPGWGKRAPGWGKRNYELELIADGGDAEKRAPGWGKRAPGWGKRNYDVELDDETEYIQKRAPGWGKRAPGWGKRNDDFDVDDDTDDVDKRAPGWGKRAPGWGKRSFQIQRGDDSLVLDKRAPGWGKRASSKSKKAPGWGKRSVRENCQELQGLTRDYIDKVLDGKLDKCGNMKQANKPTRK